MVGAFCLLPAAQLLGNSSVIGCTVMSKPNRRWVSCNSLNGGSLGHGGTELKLAPPDADTLVPDPLLDAGTPVDDRPDP